MLVLPSDYIQILTTSHILHAIITLLQAIIISCLDYFNNLLIGLLSLPPSVSSQHNIQSDPVKIYIRSCHSPALNPLKVSHHCYSESLSPYWDSHGPI